MEELCNPELQAGDSLVSASWRTFPIKTQPWKIGEKRTKCTSAWDGGQRCKVFSYPQTTAPPSPPPHASALARSRVRAWWLYLALRLLASDSAGNSAYPDCRVLWLKPTLSITEMGKENLGCWLNCCWIVERRLCTRALNGNWKRRDRLTDGGEIDLSYPILHPRLFPPASLLSAIFSLTQHATISSYCIGFVCQLLESSATLHSCLINVWIKDQRLRLISTEQKVDTVRVNSFWELCWGSKTVSLSICFFFCSNFR